MALGGDYYSNSEILKEQRKQMAPVEMQNGSRVLVSSGTYNNVLVASGSNPVPVQESELSTAFHALEYKLEEYEKVYKFVVSQLEPALAPEGPVSPPEPSRINTTTYSPVVIRVYTIHERISALMDSMEALSQRIQL